MTAAARAENDNAVELFDGIVERGPPLIPDGEYLARFTGHDCCELPSFNSARVFLHFKLLEGEHAGTTLFRAYRVRKIFRGAGRVGTPIRNGRFVLGRRSELLKMIVRVLDVRVRPDRVSLRSFKQYVLRVRTRTVRKDFNQMELPTALHYSVVDTVLHRETGQ